MVNGCTDLMHDGAQSRRQLPTEMCIGRIICIRYFIKPQNKPLRRM